MHLICLLSEPLCSLSTAALSCGSSQALTGSSVVVHCSTWADAALCVQTSQYRASVSVHNEFRQTVCQVCQQEHSPDFMCLVMIEYINPTLFSLSLSLCLCAGTGSQCRHRICRGRATGGDVLREAQHARQHSDWPLGTWPIQYQELRRHQRGCAAVLPGGESLWHRLI